DERLETEKEIHLYRVVQELVSNTLKHAYARQISILLEKKDQQLTLKYKDDGRGFDATQPVKGIGMKNIVSRMAKINGEWQFHTDPGEGIEATAVITV
ncbi:MAG: sensor histidine kinase, partial [Cyclobacteriaceae bacterium]|nr:sensor histidine kinase [Cyclobacteriaceae bacterium HetDA_MAG_MS6]